MKLDALDSRILEILRQDARASYREIARRTGSTTPTVARRVRALEELGVIQGYGARVEFVRIGGVESLLLLSPSSGATERLLAALGAEPAVAESLELDDGTVLARLLTGSEEEAAEVRRRIAKLPFVREADARRVRSGSRRAGRGFGTGRATLEIRCFLCGGPLPEEPVSARIGGKRGYFCCTTCRGVFRDRYRRLAAGR
ncbi:MAG TPA: winged helix-turn-helix transcriptional regulator [Candidatus Thermoplasmatota archaeon]|nr:winged helix-turn-helix transcriptional regulator [Candidatus Thermoplasmatota archaeon]